MAAIVVDAAAAAAAVVRTYAYTICIYLTRDGKYVEDKTWCCIFLVPCMSTCRFTGAVVAKVCTYDN